MRTLTYIVQSCHHLVSSVTRAVFASSSIKILQPCWIWPQNSGGSTIWVRRNTTSSDISGFLPFRSSSGAVTRPLQMGFSYCTWRVELFRATTFDCLNCDRLHRKAYLFESIVISSGAYRTYLNWFPQWKGLASNSLLPQLSIFWQHLAASISTSGGHSGGHWIVS